MAVTLAVSLLSLGAVAPATRPATVSRAALRMAVDPAGSNGAHLTPAQKAELAEVAAKMKADAAKRKKMRKAGAPSTKNIDKSHFIEKCGPHIDTSWTGRISCA